jgi:hypothetical protein
MDEIFSNSVLKILSRYFKLKIPKIKSLSYGNKLVKSISTTGAESGLEMLVGMY